MAWAKDFKGFMWDTITIGSFSAPITPTQYTDWFDFSDFAMPFDEFTFVLNYKNVQIGDINEKVGVAISLEWDLDINDTTDITTEIVLSGDDSITSWPNGLDSMHVQVLDKDLSDVDDINIALARRFRFKMVFSQLAGESYSDNDIMHLAIVPHNGG
tara:strand:- start:8567 stop:9037 length:471 start_codon:yes stop_codon:yes gene_type:complete